MVQRTEIIEVGILWDFKDYLVQPTAKHWNHFVNITLKGSSRIDTLIVL